MCWMAFKNGKNEYFSFLKATQHTFLHAHHIKTCKHAEMCVGWPLKMQKTLICVLEILHSHWLILNLLCSEDGIILTSLKIARSL